MNLRDFFEFRRLSQRRLCSEKDYLEFQAFQARQLLDYLAQHGVIVHGRVLLDLGSGIGGYSLEFARSGARVISLDLTSSPILGTRVTSQIRASALRVPFDSETVDIVFCASLIEHVAMPEAILAEIERVLRPGGVSYVSFPPYYSPLGGHEYSPFHYFGEKLAMRLVRRQSHVPVWLRERYRIPNQANTFSGLYQGWGLYKMTIAKFRRLLSATRLICEDSSTRYLPIDFSRLPVLGEVLTWHVQYLLRKSDLSR